MGQNISKVNDLKKYVEKCRYELTDENCFGCPLWVRSDHGLKMNDDEILVFNPSPLVKFLDEGDVLSVKTAFNPTTELKLHVRNAPIDELSKIIINSANRLDITLDYESAEELARRSRGTPRIANGLLRRVRDFAQVKGNGNIDTKIAKVALTALNIDEYGLDDIDNKILTTIIDKFKGGPVGIGTIATAIGEDAGTIEDVYEPYLIMEGFLKRTSRGRMVTELAYNHLGRDMYRTNSNIISPSFFD